MFSLKALEKPESPFFWGWRGQEKGKRHDTHIKQTGNIASRLVTPPLHAPKQFVSMCACSSIQHLLLYLLFETITTITDGQASTVSIDCYCSTLFCIRRKSLTFWPTLSWFCFCAMAHVRGDLKERNSRSLTSVRETHFLVHLTKTVYVPLITFKVSSGERRLLFKWLAFH